MGTNVVAVSGADGNDSLSTFLLVWVQEQWEQICVVDQIKESTNSR